MKGRTKLLQILLLFIGTLRAQDSLVLKREPPKLVSVKEITPQQVKFKRSDNPDGPIYSVEKSEILYIRYANGLKENIDSVYSRSNFAKPAVREEQEGAGNNENMHAKGMKDARIYYRHNGGSIGVGVTSFLIGIFGLIPAVVVSAVPPKEKNLGFPKWQYWEQNAYKAGYKQTAHKMKKKRVWTGFGVGFGASILFLILISR